MRLAGKTALVTGAGQGIGAAIATRLARAGAKAVLVDRDAAALQSAAASLAAVLNSTPSSAPLDGLGVTGRRSTSGVESWALASPADTYVADVAKKDDVHAVVAQVLAKDGRIDILVNNAGIIRDGFISKLSEEDWDQVIDVNLKGTFLFCQAVFPAMKSKSSGKIVNIASRAWLGNVGQSNYAASKGGVVSLTRTLALEFARFQINVNAVAPGLIDTPMTRNMPQEARERLLRMQPTGKMGSAEDIAAAVEFLASDDAQFITGQVLHVDGGKSCGLLSL